MKRCRFEIRMTETELEVLTSKAKAVGMSNSSYVRDLIGFKTVERPNGRPPAGYDPKSDDPRRTNPLSKVPRPAFACDEISKKIKVGRQEINKNALDKVTPGFGTDYFGNKRNLAKPKKK